MADKSLSPQRKKSTKKTFDITYGHVQPQALELEKVVLGALMIDKDAFSMVAEILQPKTFYEPRHQKIFEAIQSLSANDHPVDIMTVTNELKRAEALDEVGGATYILELSSSVASSAHIEFHAQILQQKFLARQLISYAGVIETKAFDESTDVYELVQEAEGTLFEISQRNMKRDYVQIDSEISKAMKILQMASANSSGITGVPTGYAKLDEITSGWQRSDLIIIAGRPAMGKTSFALSLAKNIAVDHQIPTAFFSLEMSNVQLVNRLISNVCEIPGNKMLSGQLQPDEWDRLDKRINQLYGAPLYVDDTPGMSVMEFSSKARRLVREKGVKIIMIDYLQLMNARGMDFSNRQEEVSKISSTLKNMAKDLDIPILALSQLNRTVDNREDKDKRPQLSDLRESGAIEQDADMVLFVHRPEYYHIYEDPKHGDMRGMAQIIIAKHRKGATGDVLLAFRGEYTRFQDPDRTSRSNAVPLDAEIVGSGMNDMNDPLGPPASYLEDDPGF